tara:strand:+ start:126 stop:509 length:384 start_codon:yes stop_codon:yes gene_type:complete
VDKKIIIQSRKAPKAIGTYSQGIICDNLIFTSGQIPIDPRTNEVVSDIFEKQVEQVLYNLEQILIEAGSSKDKIIKLTVYLTDLSNFNKVNDVFLSFFIDNFPARSLVEVSALPKNVNIEIEAICLK